MSLSERLNMLKNQNNMTTERLSELSSVPVGTINKLLNGETQNPTAKTLRKLAEALNSSAEFLYSGHEKAWETYQTFDNILPIETRHIPLLGTIACGEPIYAEEDFECTIAAGSTVKADFALRCKGNSMTGAGIKDGDIVLIRKQDSVNDGEIAVVILDDEATLKRVYKLPGGMVQLRAENPAYAPIYIGGEGETRNCRILGKAVAYQSDIY